MNLSIAIASMLFIVAASVGATPTYSVTLVHAPSGFDGTYGSSINDSRQIVVHAFKNGGGDAWFLWSQDGTYNLISSPDGATISSITSINKFGELAGHSKSGAFFWSPKSGAATISPPAGYLDPLPTGVNDQGVVVGYATRHSARYSFSWTERGGSTVVLPSRSTYATGLNNAGDVVVTAVKKKGTEALIIRVNGNVLTTGLLSKSDSSTSAAINESRVVAMNYASGTQGWATRWSKKVGVTLIGGGQTEAIGIDNANEVVGYDESAKQYLGGFIWRHDYGEILLIDALTAGSPSFSALDPSGISPNSGEIVSSAVLTSGEFVAAVLRPAR